MDFDYNKLTSHEEKEAKPKPEKKTVVAARKCIIRLSGGRELRLQRDEKPEGLTGKEKDNLLSAGLLKEVR